MSRGYRDGREGPHCRSSLKGIRDRLTVGPQEGCEVAQVSVILQEVGRERRSFQRDQREAEELALNILYPTELSTEKRPKSPPYLHPTAMNDRKDTSTGVIPKPPRQPIPDQQLRIMFCLAFPCWCALFVLPVDLRGPGNLLRCVAKTNNHHHRGSPSK